MRHKPAEAYVLGYKRGWDQALALAIRIEQAINNSDDLFSDRMPAMSIDWQNDPELADLVRRARNGERIVEDSDVEADRREARKAQEP